MLTFQSNDYFWMNNQKEFDMYSLGVCIKLFQRCRVKKMRLDSEVLEDAEQTEALLKAPEEEEVVAARLSAFTQNLEADLANCSRHVSFTELLLGDSSNGFLIGSESLDPNFSPVAPFSVSVGGLGNARTSFNASSCVASAIAGR